MMRWREPGYPGDECPGKQGYPGMNVRVPLTPMRII